MVESIVKHTLVYPAVSAALEMLKACEISGLLGSMNDPKTF